MEESTGEDNDVQSEVESDDEDRASFLFDFLHPRFLREAELKESFIQPS